MAVANETFAFTKDVALQEDSLSEINYKGSSCVGLRHKKENKKKTE